MIYISEVFLVLIAVLIVGTFSEYLNRRHEHSTHKRLGPTTDAPTKR